jgi:hypothetical protein
MTEEVLRKASLIGIEKPISKILWEEESNLRP